MVTVIVEGEYDVDAETLWRHVVRYDTLQALMNAGAVRVALPEGEEREGDDLHLTFRLWNRLPVGRWRIHVVERDDARMRLKSEESGAGVRRWAHTIDIAPVSAARARQTDTIEIEAGALTPLIAAFAQREYTIRHRTRARLLAGCAQHRDPDRTPRPRALTPR